MEIKSFKNVILIYHPNTEHIGKLLCWKEGVGLSRHTLAGSSVRAGQDLSIVSRAGSIYCTHWFLYQLPLEERILRMKNVLRPPCQAVKTLKYCYWWVDTLIHKHTNICFWHNCNKNDFEKFNNYIFLRNMLNKISK